MNETVFLLFVLAFNNGFIIAWQYSSGNTSSWRSKTVNFSIAFKNIQAIVLGAYCSSQDFSNTAIAERNIVSRTWYSSYNNSTITIQNGASIRILIIGN